MTTQAQDIEARRTQVSRLMLARKSQRDMAALLSVSQGTITGDVKAVRAEWLATRLEDVEVWRAEELARLAAAEAAIWQRVLAGELIAIDRLLGILDRRARYLGLDQPIQVDVRERLEAYAIERAQSRGMDEAQALAAVDAILKAAKR